MSKQKRCFDFILSVFALILLAPIMLLIGLLIRITSKGPALFRQARVGLDQQPFVILKFRTMKHCNGLDDRGLTVTRQGDPRMTRLGTLLRRLKLDELPQLINVARGDMSLVGPRPKIPEHENLLMLCRPGITGAATILFSHEESLLADVPEEFVEHYVTSVLNPEKCRLDSHYIETAGFGADIAILVRTVFKLSNGPQSARAPQLKLMIHEKPSLVRQASIDLSEVEGVESSAQEILRSA